MLRIATWNVGLARLRLFGRPAVDAVPHADLRIGPILQALARNAPGADIWLLQEVYHPSVVKRLRRLAPWQCFSSLDAGADLGLCILAPRDWHADGLAMTRYPPVDWVERVVARKGVISLTIDTPLGQVAVGCTHLSYDGRGRARIAARAPLLRRREVQIAVQHMAQAQPEAPRILGGDFNFSSTAEPAAYAEAIEAGYVDLRSADARFDDGGVASWSHRNALTGERDPRKDADIDLLFARGFEGRRVRSSHILTDTPLSAPDGAAMPLSDHYGLLAEIGAPPAAPTAPD